MKSSPIKLKTYGGPNGGKQKLSKAARAKRNADNLVMAKTEERKRRKKENQATGKQNSKTDLHHRPDGSIVTTSRKNNRNVWKHGERT